MDIIPAVSSSLPDPIPIPVTLPIQSTQSATQSNSSSSVVLTEPDSVPVSNVHPMTTRSKAGIFKPKAFGTSKTEAASMDYTITKPLSFKVATKYKQWCTAMDEEFEALTRQGTWVLVPPSPTQNVVGCKWFLS